MIVGWLGGAYPWVRAAHIIFVIYWMAGLFMLPRYFIYHQEAAIGSDEDRAWIARERRILSIILDPAMIVVWVVGLMLAANGGYWGQLWFQLKLLLVAGLSAYHMWMGGYANRLAKGERPLPGRTLRLLNEVPGVAIILIVLAVAIRPSLT